MNRPETFQEWRSLWHNLAMDVGHHVAGNIDARRPVLDRVTWELTDQMRRVYLRMEVEREAFTESYGMAVLAAIMTKD